MSSDVDDGHAELCRNNICVKMSFCEGYVTGLFEGHTLNYMFPYPITSGRGLYIPLLYLAEDHSNSVPEQLNVWPSHWVRVSLVVWLLVLKEYSWINTI